MLVNTFGKKITASLVVKNSEFYIEVAKFVQAYTIILHNPNEFLNEIGERQIGENEKLSWEMLSKIMKTCDFGFLQPPTDSELLVFFNYAIEMGSIEKRHKRLATVDDIADAQKNYYNFVDEATDRAEAEFLKQRRISKLREKEVRAIDNKLAGFSAQKWFAFSLMIVAVIFFCLGVAGLFFTNPLVEQIGSIISIKKSQYIGAVILIILSILMFWLCDKWHLKTKQEYAKLNHASQTIFSRNNNNFITEQILKYKLDSLKRDLQTIHNELNDENKTYDVKNNIEKLSETNDYYKKYYKSSEKKGYSAEATAEQMTIDDQKEMIDNQSFEQAQEIILEGQFDENAYNEKFEKVSEELVEEKTSETKQEIEENREIQEEKLEAQQLQEEERIKHENIERENLERKKLEEEAIKMQLEDSDLIAESEEKQPEELLDSIDNISDEQLNEYLEYLKEILGDNMPQNLNEKEK